jgi:O-antigen/teichoic acid export membrane protein
LGSGGGRAIGLLTALVSAAVLGSEQYGVFAFLAVTATLLSSFGVLGFAPLTTQAIAMAPGQRQSRVLAAAALSAVIGLLLAWCVTFVSVTNLVHLGHWVNGYLLLHGLAGAAIVTWTLGSGTSAVVTAVLAGHKRFDLSTKLAVARAAAVGVATASAGFATGSASHCALAAGSAETLMAGFGLALLIRKRWCAFADWRELVAPARTLARGSIPAGFAALSIHAAIWFMASLLLSRPSGLAENGGFALANRLSLFVSFIPGALAVSSVSYVASQTDPERARALALRVVRTGTGLACATALGLVAVASNVVGLFGASYSPFSSTTAIMAVAGFAISANALLGNVAVGLGKIGAWVMSDLVLGIALAGAAIALVPTYGGNGAALATLIAYGVSVVFLAIALRTAS